MEIQILVSKNPQQWQCDILCQSHAPQCPGTCSEHSRTTNQTLVASLQRRQHPKLWDKVTREWMRFGFNFLVWRWGRSRGCFSQFPFPLSLPSAPSVLTLGQNDWNTFEKPGAPWRIWAEFWCFSSDFLDTIVQLSITSEEDYISALKPTLHRQVIWIPPCSLSLASRKWNISQKNTNFDEGLNWKVKIKCQSLYSTIKFFPHWVILVPNGVHTTYLPQNICDLNCLMKYILYQIEKQH